VEESKSAVGGDLALRHKLVRGQNRREVFGLDSSRVAVSVIEASPVSMETVPPQVPLVRNGSFDLLVRVDRPEGYKSAISIRLLYLPAGLSASTSVSIPADKSEAIIPMTANASAALGNWPMIVIGTIDIGHGTIELATKPVNLEVAESAFTFEFPKTSAELEGEAQVHVRVTVNRKLDGPAEIEMVGFPAGVTPLSPKISVSQETDSLSFPVKIAANARVGQHKTLVCKATIHAPGGEILQTNGNGTLQIDPPSPNNKGKNGAEKPLSRLEQLRQNREQP
jgi:hypothetical protein